MNAPKSNMTILKEAISLVLIMKVIVVLLMPTARAEDCSKLDWAKSSARTQAGGWIWFPGVHTSDLRSTSIITAEGVALEYEIGECGIIHKKTQFNERCTERNTNGTFTTFVRAAIKAKHCAQALKASGTRFKARFENRVLTTRMNAYKLAQADSKIHPECEAGKKHICYLEFYSAHKSGNYLRAAAHSKIGCILGDKFMCGTAAASLAQAGMFKEAISWARQGCAQEDSNSCMLQKRLKKELVSGAIALN